MKFIWLIHRKVVILQADYYQPLDSKVKNERVKPPSEVFLWISLHGNTERKGAFLNENRVALKEKEEKSFLVVII